MSFFTLYAGTAKRVLGTMLGVTSAAGRQKIHELYNWYSPPKFDPNAFPKDPYIIPKTDVFELTNSEQNLTYNGVYDCGFGHLNEFELKVLCHLVKSKNPQTIFEIGTFEGRTTLNLALNAADDAKIYTLDLPQSLIGQTQYSLEPDEVKYVIPDSGKRFNNQAVASKITKLSGDSATFDFSPYHKAIDMVIIDGSHAKDYVKNDTEKALQMLKEGGIIIWANYTNWVGVRVVLNEYFKEKSKQNCLKHIGGTSLVVFQ